MPSRAPRSFALFTSMMSTASARKHHVVALSIAVLSLVLTPGRLAFALNPTLDVSQYAHTAWTVADGFTKGAVTSIAQTPDGYLWLGTEFGLLRFDGVRTTPSPSGLVLPSGQIRTLLTGRDGTLWVGTSNGLVSWKNGKLAVFPQLAGHLVLRMLEDRDGAVWVRATTPPTGKLCAIRNGAVRCWGEDNRFGSQVTTLYEDRKGNLWFAEPHGVWRWNQGQPQFLPLATDRFVQGLSEDADGVLLVLSSGGIYRLVDGKLREAYRLPGALGQLTTSFVWVLYDRDGGLWFGALGGGLAHLHGGTIDRFSESDGLSSDSVGAMFQDREGNIWVGTHAGLDRFRELAVTPLTMRQGFSSLRVLAVAASTDGSMWVRTVDGLNQWKAGRVSVYPEFPDLSDETPSLTQAAGDTADNAESLVGPGGSLFQDERGRIWVSTTRSVGYLVDHGRFTALRGAPGGRVHSITGDLKGNVWFANEQGLLHVARERIVEQIPWARLGHADYADTLAVDPSTGGLWLGFFRGGVELLKDGEIRASYTAADGLAPGRINELRFGRDGALWAAAEGGVSRLKDGQFRTLSSRSGLPCTESHWTIEDDDGDFWLSMPCGLVRIARTELNAWVTAADGKRPGQPPIRLTLFDTSDGVRSRANAGPFTPHVAKGQDGRLWFFPLEGLSVIDPRRVSSNTLPPLVQIERITADSRTYEPASEVRLPPLIRDLGIAYTAPSFVAPEKVTFRIKLEGRDREWQDVSTRRQAFYTNLGPGHYTFRVIAGNNSGVWNEQGAALAFVIAPAYYQTMWFRAAAVATFAILVFGVHRLRLRIVERHEAEINALNESLMKAQEQERTRIAGELHDGVMQQITALSLTLGTGKRQAEADAKKTMADVQRKLIEVGTEVRQLAHDLHPPMLKDAGLPEALRGYCEEFSRARNLPVSCDADDSLQDLSPGAALALFRVVQEALGNAATHGAPQHVDVRLTRSAGRVTLSVSDNGKGFDRNRISTVAGIGLVNMRERARQLNGTFELDSGPGRGTTVRVSIPFRPAE